ncbi:MAG: superoxide dismutase [Tenuifilaceae bacterium]
MKANKILLAAFCFQLFVVGVKAQNTSGFTFPALPYSYDALEPYIDKATMEIHYDRHFRAYYNNFIKAVEPNSLNGKSLEEIFANVSKYPAVIRNSGGGYYNHDLFWQIMSSNGGGMPSENLLNAIKQSFGTYEVFVTEFEKAANTQFGSGWAWLSVDESGKLFISQLPNQDNPLMDIAAKRGKPILALDVWEHAYYLKYQNKRAEYVTNFWKIINWSKVEEKYLEAKKK